MSNFGSAGFPTCFESKKFLIGFVDISPLVSQNASKIKIDGYKQIDKDIPLPGDRIL